MELILGAKSTGFIDAQRFNQNQRFHFEPRGFSQAQRVFEWLAISAQLPRQVYIDRTMSYNLGYNLRIPTSDSHSSLKISWMQAYLRE
jgi:hypothetical protein